jgi:hypothetical protein
VGRNAIPSYHKMPSRSESACPKITQLHSAPPYVRANDGLRLAGSIEARVQIVGNGPSKWQHCFWISVYLDGTRSVRHPDLGSPISFKTAGSANAYPESTHCLFPHRPARVSAQTMDHA